MVIPLQLAYLCPYPECEVIFEGPGKCPKCLSPEGVPLAKVLNRTTLNEPAEPPADD